VKEEEGENCGESDPVEQLRHLSPHGQKTREDEGGDQQ
jgi:hypothetical protein